MALEVQTNTLIKSIFADPSNELLEHRGALRIGDAIKIIRRSRDIGDIGNDRMCCRVLVLGIGPCFTANGEGRPLPRVDSCLCCRSRSLILSKGLLQPQVVPPSGSDKITEPHVAHFVKNRVCSFLSKSERGSISAQIALCKCHASRVFHCPEVIFGHENLVVASPGIGIPVTRVIVIEAGARDRQDIVAIHRFSERLPTHQTQVEIGRGAISRAAFPPSPINNSPLAGDNGSDVARQWWRG